MKRVLAISTVFLLALTGLFGQTQRAYIVAAENALAEKDYFSAFHYFSYAVEIDSSLIGLRYQLAEVARHYNAYSTAERMYATVLLDEDVEKYPETAFWLGQMQMFQAKYDSAMASFQVFLGEFGEEETDMVKEAERLLYSCQWAKDNLQTIGDSILVERIDSGGVNTNYCELGAIEYEEMLYFSRLGFERFEMEKKRKVYPSRLYTKVLVQEDSSSTPTPLDSTLNDSLLHTAHVTFNHDGSRVYYTLCEYLNRSDIRCDIYYRDIVNDVWGEPHKLPEPINIDSVTTTMPNVAYDERVGSDVLYFVSDRDGGKGGLDLWYSVIQDDSTFTVPKNMAVLNTLNDDVSPFLHEESSTLYFSTNGRNGFGGFDIFRAEQDTSGYVEPVNLGPEYNSSYHDISYWLSDDESEGMLATNRVGATYLDAEDEACCYDIYKISKEPVEVKLIVETFNAMTGEPLTDVLLYIQRTNGETVSVAETTGATNRFEMSLKRNKQYTITGEKRTFNPDITAFDTYHITSSLEIRQQLYLDPSDVVVEVRTFDLRRKLPLAQVSVELADSAGAVLDTRINQTLNTVYFSVPPNAAYTLTGSRKGYRKATAYIAPEDVVNRDTIVRELYLELGNLEDFLPLAIYFANDEPDPRSQALTTDKRYLETYDSYYSDKNKFARRYSRGLSGDEEAQAEAAIEDFFENNLRKSKEEFESFLNILDQYLNEGLTFTIFLKGYTSPLASEDYNYKLGQRRINSIQNEFASFRGGDLMRFLETGDLVVTEKSFGEGEAPPDVSDDASNVRLSIYSPAASKERRVEIIEIMKDNPEQ